MRVVFAAIAALSLAACTTSGNVSTNPAALTDTSSVPENTAIVIVGNASTATVNSLQFVHSIIPPINVRDIALAPNGVAIVPVPVGIRELSLATFTTNDGGGTPVAGISLGFQPVRSPKLNIGAAGLYYIGTIRSDRQHDFVADPKFLAQFRKTYPQLAKLKPVNFQWR